MGTRAETAEGACVEMAWPDSSKLQAPPTWEKTIHLPKAWELSSRKDRAAWGPLGKAPGGERGYRIRG